MDIFRFLRSVLSMNNATGNYLWVAPLKLDLFPYILRPFTFPPPHVLYNLSGSWLNWSLWRKKEGLPKFLHPSLQRVNFMVSIQRRVQWRVSLPIFHLYCIGRGTKVTVVVTGLAVYDPLKWLRMEIGRYLGWHFEGYEDISCSCGRPGCSLLQTICSFQPNVFSRKFLPKMFLQNI